MKLEQMISPKLLSSLDKLLVSIRVESVLENSGKRKSYKKGSSLDFSDFRAYSQGDDLRKIDWKGYARSGKTNIKLYDEEKSSNINIILDCSKSMDFGKANENKFLYAKLLAVALSYIHMKNDDKVNIFSMDKEIKAVCLNNFSSARLNKIVKALDDVKIATEVDFENCKFTMIKNGGISFIISDFYTKEGYKSIVKALQQKAQRVYLIHILTKEENKPKLSGNFSLIDCEKNLEKAMFITQEQISEYERLLNLHKREIKHFSDKRKVMYFDFSTDINLLETVLGVMNRE